MLSRCTTPLPERSPLLLLLLTALAGLCGVVAYGQTHEGQEYRVLEVGSPKGPSGHLCCWLDAVPGTERVGLSSTQGYPFRSFPADDPASVIGLDIGNWHAGSRIKYSSTGKYILLQQLFYLDMAPNKDRPVRYEVVDAGTGKRVLELSAVHAAVITPDERSVVAVDRDGVLVVDIGSGRQQRTGLVRTGNALSISPDGSMLAVAHKPTRTELEGISALRNDKDALKAALKVGQVVQLYSWPDLKPLFMLDELMDKVFRLEHSPDGLDLWVHAKPHTRKNRTPVAHQSYVSVADATTGAMRRSSFPSMALHEPDMRISADGRLFAIGSQHGKFMEVHVYDRASATLRHRFVLSFRQFEGMAKDFVFPSDGRLSFLFLPDGRRMLMTFGNRLIEWTYAP